MEMREQVRILCVDDEPNVLEGLSRALRRQFDVKLAVGASEGLDVLGREGPFAVVVSDLRMPGMDGVGFLTQVREIAPDSVRVLLTGQGDLDSAAGAVNQGQVFRFLTKPCSPEQLQHALSAAAEQHRLITSERVLLEQTLHGSIKALTDVLALVYPAAFARAARAKDLVAKLAGHLEIKDRWQIEVAAMLSQIGSVTLPPETAERLYHGQFLTEAEREMVDRLPRLAEEVAANIPRMEEVRAIFAALPKRFDQAGDSIPIGSRVLKLVLDYDLLESQGLTPSRIVDALRDRGGCYDPEVLEALWEIHGATSEKKMVREIDLRDVQAGMILVEDLHTSTGVLLLARGQELTPRAVERLRNLVRGAVSQDRIHVVIP